MEVRPLMPEEVQHSMAFVSVLVSMTIHRDEVCAGSFLCLQFASVQSLNGVNRRSMRECVLLDERNLMDAGDIIPTVQIIQYSTTGRRRIGIYLSCVFSARNPIYAHTNEPMNRRKLQTALCQRRKTCRVSRRFRVFPIWDTQSDQCLLCHILLHSFIRSHPLTHEVPSSMKCHR